MPPNGITPCGYGPVSARRHDSAMLRMGGLVAALRAVAAATTDACGQVLCLCGGPAYPSPIYLQGPFKGSNIGEAKELANKAMGSVRESVEWGFGKVCALWACVGFKKGLHTPQQPAARYYQVATWLANCHTCCNGSVTSSYFASANGGMPVHLPSLEEYFQMHGVLLVWGNQI